jgi:hypothetical protein
MSAIKNLIEFRFIQKYPQYRHLRNIKFDIEEIPEDLIIVENRLNGIVPVPYNEWIDVRNPEEFERVKRGLNKYEMIAYVSKTRSKWSMALWNNEKFVEYGGVTKGNEIRPKFIMRINVENFNIYNDSAEVFYNKKSK